MMIYSDFMKNQYYLKNLYVLFELIRDNLNLPHFSIKDILHILIILRTNPHFSKYAEWLNTLQKDELDGIIGLLQTNSKNNYPTKHFTFSPAYPNTKLTNNKEYNHFELPKKLLGFYFTEDVETDLSMSKAAELIYNRIISNITNGKIIPVNDFSAITPIGEILINISTQPWKNLATNENTLAFYNMKKEEPLIFVYIKELENLQDASAIVHMLKNHFYKTMLIHEIIHYLDDVFDKIPNDKNVGMSYVKRPHEINAVVHEVLINFIPFLENYIDTLDIDKLADPRTITKIVTEYLNSDVLKTIPSVYFLRKMKSRPKKRLWNRLCGITKHYLDEKLKQP